MNLYLFIETTVPFCKWLKTILLDTGLDSPSTTDKQPTIRCIQHYNKSTRISRKRQHFCQRCRLPNPVNTDQLHHLDPVNLSSMPIGEITSACSGKDLPFAPRPKTSAGRAYMTIWKSLKPEYKRQLFL